MLCFRCDVSLCSDIDSRRPHTYTHTHIHVYIYICMYVYTHNIHRHADIYIYIYIYGCSYSYIRTYACVYTYIRCTRFPTDTCIHVCVYFCIHLFIDVCVNKYMYILHMLHYTPDSNARLRSLAGLADFLLRRDSWRAFWESGCWALGLAFLRFRRWGLE